MGIFDEYQEKSMENRPQLARIGWKWPQDRLFHESSMNSGVWASEWSLFSINHHQNWTFVKERKNTFKMV
jgi:hypothetical protein